MESGNIIKGTFVVSGNYNLVDKLKKDSNIDVTLYYGEKTVVTSLMDEQQNRMSDLSAEQPVIGEDGSVTGMIFTGKKSDTVNEMLSEATVKMLIISVMVIAAAVIFTVVMAASITKSLKYAKRAFGNVAEGNLQEQNHSKYQKRGDEIGDMIHGIERLKGSLRDIIGKR